MRTEALVLLAILSVGCRKQTSPEPRRVREPIAAGSYYPADPSELRAQVQAFLSAAPTRSMVAAPVILVPHAGYAYSASVAAAALEQLPPGFERVVLLAANHSEGADFAGVSVERVTHYRIPGSEIAVSREVAERLLSSSGFVDVPAAHASHVIEVELPFLRAVNRDQPFEIVPLIVGSLTREQGRELARALSGLASPKTVFVFSVDLSHYHPEPVAHARDGRCLEALARMNADEVALCETDGTQVLLAMTELAALLGLTPRRIAYATSGDSSDDKERVVGYGALAYEARFELGDEESAALLRLAKSALEAAVRKDDGAQAPDALLERYPRLGIRRAAFVTLRKQGELRGCIGSLEADRPLAEDVASNAVSAALRDSRFEPVTPDELPQIELSISVLDAPRPIERTTQEELVRRLAQAKPGLIIEYHGRRSTFLPEVWDELPEPARFLEELCLKQGSPASCWRSPEARFESYGAQHLAAR